MPWVFVRRWMTSMLEKKRLAPLPKDRFPTNLQALHEAYQPERVSPYPLITKLIGLWQHPFLQNRPVVNGQEILLDLNPSYTITLIPRENRTNFSLCRVAFFGITVDTNTDKIHVSPTEVYSIADIQTNPSLQGLMARWIACVEASFLYRQQQQDLVIEQRLQSHPLMQAKPVERVLFETQRHTVRNLLEHYQERKPSLHANFHKEFEWRIAEPLRRLDPLLPAEDPKITTLVEQGYLYVRNAQNASEAMKSGAYQEEAEVIYTVAMARIEHELFPALKS